MTPLSLRHTTAIAERGRAPAVGHSEKAVALRAMPLSAHAAAAMAGARC
jgi:hypothetical protein